jgi:hypothetical protein
MTRALHVIAMWLVAWTTMQVFGQVLSADGIVAFLRTKYRKAF